MCHHFEQRSYEHCYSTSSSYTHSSSGPPKSLLRFIWYLALFLEKSISVCMRTYFFPLYRTSWPTSFTGMSSAGLGLDLSPIGLGLGMLRVDGQYPVICLQGELVLADLLEYLALVEQGDLVIPVYL